MQYFVYILTNTTNVVLYTGVTKNLEKRLWEHRNHVNPNSFSARYNIHKLVFFETTSSIKAAIARERQIKAMSRAKKNQLIEKQNPNWEELYQDASDKACTDCHTGVRTGSQ